MTIDIIRSREETTFEIVGRLDTTTAPALECTLLSHLADTTSLVLDLSGLEYISSAGLRVLHSAYKRMKAVGSMQLTGVCEGVMGVLRSTGFSELVYTEPQNGGRAYA